MIVCCGSLVRFWRWVDRRAWAEEGSANGVVRSMDRSMNRGMNRSMNRDMNSKKQGKNMWLLIVLSVILVVVGFAILGRSKRQKEAAAQQARSEALQKQTRYTAASFPCSVEFPSGYAHRMTAYEPFVFHGRNAEIASCNDSTDGETWAEFYVLSGQDSGDAFLKDWFADTTHKRIRERLRYLFDYAFLEEVDALKDKIQVLSEGEKEGWKVRLAYIPTPHGVGEVRPLQVPRNTVRPEDIIAELPKYGIPSNSNETLSLWIWVGIDDFRNQADRDAFRRAERAALERLKDQQSEYRKQKERFARMHRHFYIAEAAKVLSPTQAIVVRRFGSILSSSTPSYAVDVLSKMMGEVRCEPAASSSQTVVR